MVARLCLWLASSSASFRLSASFSCLSATTAGLLLPPLSSSLPSLLLPVLSSSLAPKGKGGACEMAARDDPIIRRRAVLLRGDLAAIKSS